MTINRKTKQKANVLYTTLIVVGILILMNYLASQLFFRADITQYKDYSVSNVSKDVLSDLDDVVNIKAFFSKEVPSNLIGLKQDINDVLEEYATYSRGKIRINYIDPKENEEMEKEARNFGIPELQFSNLEKDKYQISTGYLGMAIIYGDKKEVIPVIEDTKNLEYDLTSAIKKVILKENKTIAFLKGHDELDKETELRTVSQYLGKLYNVTTVDTTNGNFIPENIDTLIIAGAKNEFTNREKYIIDQFLMRGKSLLIMQEMVDVGEMLNATSNKAGLNNLLEHYGIKVNKNFVLDPSCEMASFSSGYTQFFTNYPFWPKVGKNGFNEDSVIAGQLEAAVFPWVSSIELIEEKIKNNENFVLAKSSANSWVQEDTHNLSPQQKFDATAPGTYNLAVFVAGKFNSYFNDKDKPAKEKNELAESEDIEEHNEEFVPETKNGRIIAVGDSDFITDQFIKRFGFNMLFFQNSVDALTMDESLIKIRSKGVSDRPIKVLSDSVKNSIKIFNIFGITIIVLLAGLLRYFLRKKNKFSDQI